MNSPLPDLAKAAAPVRDSLGARCRDLARDFRRGGIEAPELDARLLVCAACGVSHAAFIAGPDRPVGPDEETLITQHRERRLAGEPVSRILGEREFRGLSFALSPDTLDPRPDTETLVAAVLELAAERSEDAAPLSILDIGTGSGCILISLLHELANARGTGSDISDGALETARANAERHGVATRARFIRSDWFDKIFGRHDFIVSNPPYIAGDEIDALAPEVARFDPRRALDGGADGLACYRRIAAGLADVLAPGGWALFEMGEGQSGAVADVLRAAGLGGGRDGMKMFRDLGGRLRCVAARAPIERTMTGQKGVGNRR